MEPNQDKQVSNAWEDIHEMWLHSTAALPKPLLLRSLNLTRVIAVMFKYEDGFTRPELVLKDIIAD